MFVFVFFWYTLCDISIPIGFLNPARCVKQVATPARVRQRHAAVDAGPAITDLDLEKTRNLDQWRKERTERKPGSLWSNDVAFFVLVASVMAMAILIWYWSVRFWPMVLCCHCELHVFSGEWQGSCRFFTLLESMDEVSFARCNALDLCWTLDWPAERKSVFVCLQLILPLLTAGLLCLCKFTLDFSCAGLKFCRPLCLKSESWKMVPGTMLTSFVVTTAMILVLGNRFLLVICLRSLPCRLKTSTRS